MSEPVRVYLVRHGEAAAGYGDDVDPGLSDKGREEAERAVALLAAKGPLPVRVSPLRRTRETAAAFERAWGVEAVVDPMIGEVESPDPDLGARAAWLRGFLGGTWDGAGAALVAWRDAVASHVLSLEEDTVAVTHFVAINAVVSTLTGDARVMCFRPANCSITVVERDGAGVRVAALGDEGLTTVL